MDTKRTYETTIIVNAGQARADREGTLNAVRELYTMEGAEWTELSAEGLGERKLAYPIQGETSGLYLEGYFTADPEIVTRIERRCGLSDVILRQIIIVRDGKDYGKITEQRVARAARKAEAAAAEA
ncbi:MAG: 30S ribosomal protein S6 [Planctomycetota bacterium]|jgi:ribosomal protein S6